MRRITTLLAAPVLALSTAGCMGPFVEEIEIDPETAERIRGEVTTVTSSELAGADYEALGMVQAVSCYNNALTDEVATEELAMDQLKYKASTLGGNAILNPTCQSEPTDLVKNCWSSVTCTGGAIRINGEQ